MTMGILEKITEWDTEIFLKIYNSNFSKNHKGFAMICSIFGNGLLFIFVWVFTLIQAFLTGDWYFTYFYLGGLVQSTILYLIIRRIVGRERPYITLRNRGVKKHDKLIFERVSFPSGHITFFLFFGIAISSLLADYWVFIVIGVVVFSIVLGFSRMILAAHFPLDIAFGFLVGGTFAFLYLFFTHSYWVSFFHWMGGAIKWMIGIS